MNLNDIEAQLGRLGYQTAQARVEAQPDIIVDGPLMVTLENDAQGRERVLMIDVVPTEEDDPIELIQFRLVYPILVEGDEETMAMLLRALLLLNSALVIGHNGFAEETPGLYYTYTLATGRAAGLEEPALDDIVGLIDYLTEWQGDLLDHVAQGRADTDEVLEALIERDLPPQPLFFRQASV